MGDQKGTPLRTIWAYGYQIAPPMSRDRLRTIERLLDDERTSAKVDARTWEGRFVVEERVTHILVVSDTPIQRLEANRRLEAELTRLKAGFTVTPSMVLEPGDGPSPARERRPRAGDRPPPGVDQAPDDGPGWGE